MARGRMTESARVARSDVALGGPRYAKGVAATAGRGRSKAKSCSGRNPRPVLAGTVPRQTHATRARPDRATPGLRRPTTSAPRAGLQSRAPTGQVMRETQAEKPRRLCHAPQHACHPCLAMLWARRFDTMDTVRRVWELPMCRVIGRRHEQWRGRRACKS